MGEQLQVWLGIGAACVLLPLVYLFAMRRARQAVLEAGRRLGLEAHRIDGTPLWGLTGVRDGVQLEVAQEPGSDNEAGVTRVVAARDGIPDGITLRLEGALERLKGVESRGDVVVGDRAFDERVHAEGPLDAVVAALSGPARASLLELTAVCKEVRLDGHRVRADLKGIARDADRLEKAVRNVVALANGARFESVADGLERNARSDPDAGVRLRNLALLHDRYPRAAREALEAALADDGPELRVFAAKRLRTTRAREALEALVSDERRAGEARAGALQALVDAYPYPAFAALVSRALSAGEPALQVAAVEAAAKGRDFDALLERQPSVRGTGAEAATAIVRALSQSRDARAEPLLVQLLAHSEAEVVRAAADALGRSGSTRAVEALLAAAERSSGEARRAAREAVRAVQARVGDAAAGQLSVAPVEGAEAGLSLADPAGAQREKA